MPWGPYLSPSERRFFLMRSARTRALLFLDYIEETLGNPAQTAYGLKQFDATLVEMLGLFSS